jgi:serine/threonine protein kinase
VWSTTPEDTRLRRKVALKFFAQRGVNDPETQASMMREAQAAVALDHPNICHVCGIHQEDGETFIAMADNCDAAAGENGSHQIPVTNRCGVQSY